MPEPTTGDPPGPRRHLRIAAHNGAPEWGGAEIAVSRLLAGLQTRGHDVRFYCARELVAERARAFGLETRPLHVGGDVALHHALRVRRALAEFEADVLLVGTFRKLLHLSLGARLARVPVISRIGLSSDLPRNAKYRLIVHRWVDRVVVTSAEVGDAWRAEVPRLPADRIALIPKGLEAPPATQTRAQVRGELGIADDQIVVLALARLVDQKRLDRFVEALSDLAEVAPGVLGLIAGEGPLRPELEAHARVHSAPVRFLGHVEEVGDLLAAADVLLITSDREAMANAMLEAMAAGVPVVSTPVAGAREALSGLEDGVAPGHVAAGFEVGDVRAALAPLVQDAPLRYTMGQAAALRAERRYGVEVMLDRWERLMLDLSEPLP